jgi:hypothetical protein
LPEHNRDVSSCKSSIFEPIFACRPLFAQNLR